MKYRFNIVLCRDTYELICFKLGMMSLQFDYTTKLYSLIFTQGHRVTGKLELAQSLCFNVA